MTSNWQLQCHRSIPTLTGTGPDPAGKSNLWWLSHHISGFYLWATVYRPPGATLSLCFPFNSGLNPSQGAAPPKGSSRLFILPGWEGGSPTESGWGPVNKEQSHSKCQWGPHGEKPIQRNVFFSFSMLGWDEGQVSFLIQKIYMERVHYSHDRFWSK